MPPFLIVHSGIYQDCRYGNISIVAYHYYGLRQHRESFESSHLWFDYHDSKADTKYSRNRRVGIEPTGACSTCISCQVSRAARIDQIPPLSGLLQYRCTIKIPRKIKYTCFTLQREPHSTLSHNQLILSGRTRFRFCFYSSAFKWTPSSRANHQTAAVSKAVLDI